MNRIPRLVLTVGDAKNSGGAPALDQLFGVGELWTSNAKFRSGAYREAIATFEPDGYSPESSRHKFFDCGHTIGCWRVLHPAAGANFPHADDNALVLMGHFRGAKILLLSDLGRAGQSDLLSRTNDLRADIVVAGLPTEGEPLCDALIRAIQPKAIVIADSEFPATRRASGLLKERLAQIKIPVFYTRIAGAVKITVADNSWRLRTMRGQGIDGW